MCAHHHHRHQDYSPWNACHRWWGWGQHQDPLPEKDDVGDFVVLHLFGQDEEINDAIMDNDVDDDDGTEDDLGSGGG